MTSIVRSELQPLEDAVERLRARRSNTADPRPKLPDK